MRLIFTILFLYAYAANATNYYVANAGSNSNNGTSIGTPFQTIAKVVSVAVSGDSVFLNKGDSWNEKLIVPASNIYFGSYGTGNKPLITGLKSVILTNTSGNLWQATVSDAVSKENIVTVNGVIQAKGRYPNTGSYLLTSHYVLSSGDTIQTSLTGTPSYVGKEIAISPVSYIWDVLTVLTQSTGVLTVSPNPTYAPHTDSRYFFQNDVSFLDVQNEWSCDSSKLLTVYSTSSPTVQYSNIDTIVFLENKNNVTFNGLNFTGANKIALNSDTSKYLTVINCTFNNNTSGITGTLTTHSVINNDSLLNAWANGIQMYTPGNYVNSCDSLNINNNYISKVSIAAGMAGDGDFGNGVAIYTQGASDSIYNNTIDSSGYIGINWAGRRNLIKNNYITNFCFIKDDGGGIYTGLGGISDAEYDSASFVTNNIILNGLGAGITGIAVGNYFDGGTRHVTANLNTINNCSYAGILLHINSAINLYNNTVVDSTGTCIWVIGGSGGSGSMTGNITYQKTINGAYHNLVMYPFSTITVPDSNYYISPIADTSVINGTNGNVNYTLPQWKIYSSLDAHSYGNPVEIASFNPTLYYNATNADSTVNLNKNKIDATGVSHSKTVVLHAFQSIILFDAIGSGHTDIGGLKFN